MSDSHPQPAVPDLIGAVLGSYRITGALSAGGMGAVYRAQHEVLGRSAAIKLLRPELTANQELVQRFFIEAKAASAIHHPGIIEVFDFGYTDDGQAFIVMELLEGESLAARIEARGRLTELEVAQIGRGIAGALIAAHAKGIVHRDLKPDNVFLVPDPDVPSGERPKVLDFGIAKLQEPVPTSARQTQTGVLMGTPLYMAPEQARAAGEIDHRADLYSLGCILYELLVGEPPFVAQGAGEIIALQLFGKAVPPSERLVEVSPELERTVMRLLEKEPTARFATAAELVEALGGTVGRLSARLSAQQAAASRSHVVALVPTERATLDDRPPARAPGKLPLIAGGIAVAIVGAVAIAIAMSGRGKHPADAEDKTQPAPPPVMVQTAPPVQPVQTPPPVETPQTKQETLTPTPTPTPKMKKVAPKTPKGPHTDKGTPIETDLGSP